MSKLSSAEAAEYFADLASRTDLQGILLVDDLQSYVETEAEYPFQDLVSSAPSLVVVASCDSATARKGYSAAIGELRPDAEVILLQPDPDMDADLLGAALPRTQRPFGPGRGVRRNGDLAEIVQLVSCL